jgi:hypothetical protein
MRANAQDLVSAYVPVATTIVDKTNDKDGLSGNKATKPARRTVFVIKPIRATNPNLRRDDLKPRECPLKLKCLCPKKLNPNAQQNATRFADSDGTPS